MYINTIDKLELKYLKSIYILIKIYIFFFFLKPSSKIHQLAIPENSNPLHKRDELDDENNEVSILFLILNRNI